jgi:hypothetical protein
MTDAKTLPGCTSSMRLPSTNVSVVRMTQACHRVTDIQHSSPYNAIVALDQHPDPFLTLHNHNEK